MEFLKAVQVNLEHNSHKATLLSHAHLHILLLLLLTWSLTAGMIVHSTTIAQLAEKAMLL